jgi:hypothetical protein
MLRRTLFLLVCLLVLLPAAACRATVSGNNNAPPAQSAATPLPAVIATVYDRIEQVDFKNFTYRYATLGEESAYCLEGRGSVTTAGGKFADAAPDGPVKYHLDVLDVAYGDVTGDGAAEAVVRVGCQFENQSGRPSTEAYLFALKEQKPEMIGIIPWGRGFGDAAMNGAIARLSIAKGNLLVERYETSPQSSQNIFIRSETMRWANDKLNIIATKKRQAVKGKDGDW